MNESENGTASSPVPGRKPPWLKRRIRVDAKSAEIGHLLRKYGLHTVCESARCPNQFECFAGGTATFMILGGICSRNCSFCAVAKGRPVPPDLEEPRHIAEVAQALHLEHVVITSVTRDDLEDGGMGQFDATVTALRDAMPEASVEILTPDFFGVPESAKRVSDIRPDIFNHNMEVVPSLYPYLRPEADWDRSLSLLLDVGRNGILTKTSLMLGLGESDSEIRESILRIREAGVSILTLGQYLQPTVENYRVVEYITPERFSFWESEAYALGFSFVASGPLVRSSYKAREAYRHLRPERTGRKPGKGDGT